MPAIRSLSRRKPRVAFVLSGGGNLGATQVGMLRALAERDIVADVVLGCSIGAFNGVSYAAHPDLEGIRRLERVWQRIAAPDVMPSSRIPSAVQLVRRGEALHGNGGLQRTILEFLGDTDTFEELQIPFQCVATDVDLATEQWFSTGRLLEPILASAALPAVYPLVNIDGRRYLDGGVVDNVPLARAVELGARKIYVLHVGLHGRPHPEVRRPLDAALIAYWIARNSRFARDLANLPRSVEAVVLPPGDRPDLRYDDFSQTMELMVAGYDRASAYLDQLSEAEQDEPSVADRLRREMFKTAEWRRVLERRRALPTLPATAGNLDGELVPSSAETLAEEAGAVPDHAGALAEEAGAVPDPARTPSGQARPGAIDGSG